MSPVKLGSGHHRRLERLVNVDAALFPEQRRMAVGAMFRDNMAHCLLAVTKERGFDKVIFASDCLSVVQRILSPKPDRSMVGVVVSEIKLLMASLASATFRHVNRYLNEAAHILARSCDVISLGFISVSAPVSIRKTLCIDIL